MWKNFKEFALEGNVFDLAVGVLIGTAFSKMVTSLVENIMTPILGILLSGIDFSNLKVTFGKAEILYGEFIQSVFDFLIIAFSIFMFTRLIIKIRKKEEVTEETEPAITQEDLLTEIRDLLKEQNVQK